MQQRRWWAGWFLLMAPLAVMADVSDVGLPVFSQGQVERETTVTDEDVRILLSAPREVRGELRARDEIRRDLSGKKRMISAGRDHSFGEVLSHYEQALDERQATALFECDGRSCGSSNVWANRVFGESRLYGRDDEQAYRVSAWRDSYNRIQLNSVYVIQRGNRSVYVYEQSFRLGEGETLDGVEIGERHLFGPVSVPWQLNDSVTVDWNDSARRQVMSLAEEYPQGRLYLVGFAPLAGQDFDDVMEATQSAVSQFKDKLEEAGVDTQRIEGKIVGPLVGDLSSGRKPHRIEVTLVRGAKDE